MSTTSLDNIPEFKTSAMLLGPTLIEHYKILATYFDPKVDVVLDVGHGSGVFSEFIVNSTGVDENTDLTTYDLSSYNTLHFSESVGYISAEVLERLISSSSIKKIVLKDFLCDTKYIEHSSFDFSTLKKIILPLLAKYSYNYTITEFTPFRDRWKALLKKYNITYTAYPDIKCVVVVATR